MKTYKIKAHSVKEAEEKFRIMTTLQKMKKIQNMTQDELWKAITENNKIGEELRQEVIEREKIGGYENLKNLRKAISKLK